MSVFTPRTWADRVVEFANRKILTYDDASTKVVTMSRSEGVVSAIGDDWKASNMNDLETRVDEGFAELETALVKIGTLYSLSVLSTSWAAEAGGYYKDVALSGLEIGTKLKPSIITPTYPTPAEETDDYNLGWADCVSTGYVRIHSKEVFTATRTVEVRILEV